MELLIEVPPIATKKLTGYLGAITKGKHQVLFYTHKRPVYFCGGGHARPLMQIPPTIRKAIMQSANELGMLEGLYKDAAAQVMAHATTESPQALAGTIANCLHINQTKIMAAYKQMVLDKSTQGL